MSSPIAKSVITISDSVFHQKIMNKYQKGIGSVFSFPLMIFSRNTTLQKMYLDIHMRFSFHEQNKLFHKILENAESFKNMFSWFNIEKFLPQIKIKSTIFKKSIENLYKPVKLIQPELIASLFPPICNTVNTKTSILRSSLIEVENTKFAAPVFYSSRSNEVDSFNPQQVIYRQSNFSWMRTDYPVEKSHGSIFLSQNVSCQQTVPYQQTFYNGIQQDGRTFNNSLLNHGNYTIIKSQIFPLNNKLHEENGKNKLYAYKNEYFWQLQSNFHHGSPFTFIQSPLLINERTFEMRNNKLYNTSQNERTFEMRNNKLYNTSQNERTFEMRNNKLYNTSQNERTFEMRNNKLYNTSQNERTFEMRNNKLYNTFPNWTSLDKLPVRNINNNLEAGTRKSLLSKKNTYSTVDNEYLIFQNQQHIEQKIDQIKKIVGDTKKTIEKSMPDNFSREKNSQPQININNLSDQVYQVIEQRLRMEKELRGL